MGVAAAERSASSGFAGLAPVQPVFAQRPARGAQAWPWGYYRTGMTCYREAGRALKPNPQRTCSPVPPLLACTLLKKLFLDAARPSRAGRGEPQGSPAAARRPGGECWPLAPRASQTLLLLHPAALSLRISSSGDFRSLRWHFLPAEPIRLYSANKINPPVVDGYQDKMQPRQKGVCNLRNCVHA